MTGPEHYGVAEGLIGGIEEHGSDFTAEGRSQVIALAQVHATLALAAATALRSGGNVANGIAADWNAWYSAASEGPADARARGEVTP